LSVAARFLLYSRPGCHLCEQMAEELGQALAGSAYTLDIADVDASGATRARWGHKIPVLMLNGEMVCHGCLDLGQVHKALAQLH
jgi:Glutaredoxin-like domain (DUF836)